MMPSSKKLYLFRKMVKNEKIKMVIKIKYTPGLSHSQTANIFPCKRVLTNKECKASYLKK